MKRKRKIVDIHGKPLPKAADSQAFEARRNGQYVRPKTWSKLPTAEQERRRAKRELREQE